MIDEDLAGTEIHF